MENLLANNFFSSCLVGMEFEFYSNFDKKDIAREISAQIGKKIRVFKKYHSKFIPTREQFKIEPDYSGGSKMVELITGPLPYFEAIPILIRILKWIDENGYTDKKCAFQFGISFDKEKYPTLPPIDSLNMLKFILGFDEEFIYDRFPDRKGSLYAKSIKKIIPSNKFLSPGKVSYIDKNQYKVPTEKNNGINFTKLKDGYFEVRYLGGDDYQKKYTLIKEVMDYIIGYTNRTLLFNDQFTAAEFSKMESILNEIYKESSAFIDAESFFKNFPGFTIMVDLKTDPQIIKSFFIKIRDVLYDIIVENGVNSGYLNYDSQISKYQLKDAQTVRAYLLKDIDLIDCKISGNVYNCRLFGCEIEGGNLEECDLISNNKIIKSKLTRCELLYSNDIEDSYIDNGTKEINCTVKGGIIRSGIIGKMAFISEDTEIVKEKSDGKKKSGMNIKTEFKNQNYSGGKGTMQSAFNDLNKNILQNPVHRLI